MSANAIYNPKNIAADDLPTIYGFNNGGHPGWFSAVLIADDGEFMGSHICSHEAYMPGDLGIVEGSRPDRHEAFREKYPDGYKMEFVPSENLEGHAGLNAAIERNATHPSGGSNDE